MSTYATAVNIDFACSSNGSAAMKQAARKTGKNKEERTQAVHVVDLTGGTSCQVCATSKPGVIDVCDKGHIFCVNCIREVTSCPICRRKFTWNEDVSLYGTVAAASKARDICLARELEVSSDYYETLFSIPNYLG